MSVEFQVVTVAANSPPGAEHISGPWPSMEDAEEVAAAFWEVGGVVLRIERRDVGEWTVV